MAAVAGTEESGSKRAKQRVSLEEALDLLITGTVSGGDTLNFTAIFHPQERTRNIVVIFRFKCHWNTLNK